MEIKDFLAPSDVVLDMRANDKTSLFDELARRAASALGLSADLVSDEILKRDELGSTGIGGGVSIPHARLREVKAPFGILARLKSAIAFDAVDGQPASRQRSIGSESRPCGYQAGDGLLGIGLELGQKDDALLLVGIGTRDNGRYRLAAQIDGEMRHSGRDVEQVARFRDRLMLKAIPIERDRLALEDVNGGFVVLMHMRFGPAAGRNGEQVHADALGSDSLGGDAAEIGQALLTLIGVISANEPARRFRRIAHLESLQPNALPRRVLHSGCRVLLTLLARVRFGLEAVFSNNRVALAAALRRAQERK